MAWKQFYIVKRRDKLTRNDSGAGRAIPGGMEKLELSRGAEDAHHPHGGRRDGRGSV